MQINSRDFILLGMNLGANQRDYAMLHGRVKLSNEDQLNDYINNCQNLNPEELEKLFALLELESNITFNPKNEAFAELIFNQGLDILENNMKNKDFQELLESNFNLFLDEVGRKNFHISDFQQRYPSINTFINNKDSAHLLNTNLLDDNIIIIKNRLEIEDNLNAVQNQLQILKDRLAINFFHQVVSSNPKPAVITLQEVQTSNQVVLDQLIEGGYQLFRKSSNSDLLIAVDPERMQNLEPHYLNDDFAAVYGEDRVTGESFIFITAHIPGYKLEIPTEPEKINSYLETVEGSFEFSTFYEIKKLANFIRELNDNYPQANLVLEGDFNTYPEYFTQEAINDKIKSMNIFTYLNVQNALNLFRTNRPTELNLFADSLHLRELDYVFANDHLNERVKIFDPENEELALVKKEKNEINFNPTLLFSDHSPIWVHVKAPQRSWDKIENVAKRIELILMKTTMFLKSPIAVAWNIYCRLNLRFNFWNSQKRLP